LASVTPKYGEYNSAAIAVKTFKLAEEANDRTRLVLPHPGGPYNKTPKKTIKILKCLQMICLVKILK